MAMSAEDIEAFITELQRDPQLRDRARNVILADDFLELPKIVARLGGRIGELVDVDGRLGERMDQLTARMDQLTVRMGQLAERVEQLALQLGGLATQVAQMVVALNRLTDRVANLEGRFYEFDFERKIGPWIGPRFRKARVLSLYDIDAFDTAVRTGVLSVEEADDANELDLIVQAEDRSGVEPEAILAFELSITVDASDIVRAARRTHLLRRCGLNAFAAVAGNQITREALESVRDGDVLTFIRKKTPAA